MDELTDAEVIGLLAAGARIRFADNEGGLELVTFHAEMGAAQFNRLGRYGWVESMANGGTFKLSDAGLLAYLRSTDELGDGDLIAPNAVAENTP